MKGFSTTKFAALAVLALAFEVTLLDVLSIGGARAEGLVVLGCYAALFARDARQGLLAAWAAGLVKDAASAGPLGLHALLFVVAAAAILRVRQLLYREHAFTQLGVAFLAAAWVNVAAALAVSLTAGGIPAGTIASKALLAAALTAAAAPPLLWLLSRARWLVV
jgi:rod shape-determining protein MreD